MRWARGLWRTLALTLRWAESSPLLRWAQTLKRARPYYAGPPHSTARLSHLGTMPCPLLRWAHDLCMSCPYFALGRVLATFALGSDSVAGRPLLRGAATLNGSSVPLGNEAVPLLCRADRPLLRRAHDLRMSGLTLRWTETGPLLRWARVPLLCPYFALGLDFGAYASARVSGPGSFLESSPSLHWARRALSLCPLLF